MFPRALQPCLLPLVHKCCIQHSQRTAVIVSRQFPPKTYKKHVFGPFRPNLKQSEMVYKFVKNTTSEPAGNMELILTVDIEGIGFKGETITVTKRVGRNYLLISGAAEYVTPENLEKWAEIRKNLPETVKQSIWARKTMRKISEMNLPIPMHPHHPWTLSPAHVVVAFRKQGVELNDSCVILPEEPVTEHGPVKFQVLVNGKDAVDINALVFPVDLENPDNLPEDFPPVWGEQEANMLDIVLEAIERNRAENSPSS